MSFLIPITVIKNDFSMEFLKVLENYNNKLYIGENFNCSISIENRNNTIIFGNFKFYEEDIKLQLHPNFCIYVCRIEKNNIYLRFRNPNSSIFMPDDSEVYIDIKSQYDDLYNTLCSAYNKYCGIIYPKIDYCVKIDDAIKLISAMKNNNMIIITKNYKLIVITFYPIIINIKIVNGDYKYDYEVVTYETIKKYNYNIFANCCIYCGNNEYITLVEKYGQYKVNNLLKQIGELNFKMAEFILNPVTYSRICWCMYYLFMNKSVERNDDFLSTITTLLKIYNITYRVKRSDKYNNISTIEI